MARPNTPFEAMARDAMGNIEAARAAGEQLTFLPDEPKAGPDGRPPRGKGKATSQLRDYLASQGMRLPEAVLIEMAGMASTEDAFLNALARTEQVLAWAQAGARETGYVIREGQRYEVELDTRPTLPMRLQTFQFVFTAQLRAAEALLPYGLGKITPDTGAVISNTIVMPGAAAPVDRAATARDITPQPRRMAPPPMPHEMQQNQGLANMPNDGSDDAIRTEGPSC